MEHSFEKDLNETDPSRIMKGRRKRFPTECKICGGPALYARYGVIVCDPCRKFFRRNADKKQDKNKCMYDVDCEITVYNRHICSSCRLVKCFASGMQLEMFRPTRTTEQYTKRNREVMKITTAVLARLKEIYQPQQLPTLNLLRSDQSTLTLEQWNLLSNLIHCYDEYSGFKFAQSYIDEQNQLLPKMRFKPTSVEIFLGSISSEGQSLYKENADFLSLCSHDRSILLHNTMKCVAGITTCFIMQHTRALENTNFYQSTETIYGPVAITHTIRAINQLDSDGTFVNLFFALLAFSTFNCAYYTGVPAHNLTDIKAVLRIQDLYTELMWKYLLYRYGHKQAVISFSNMIRSLFLYNNAIIEVAEHRRYTDMMESFVKQTEQTLTLTE